ncbi:uncharacterized protein ColSpa_08919 [Colletotrichum spaethianum]|uniref:Uncharacterized protein n=1 Tax=Colletotrichum spaethianum TaxID=700344 RepID=A0AA37URU8_9PEZI|nr:uncharacterized protein ColSpa_08919 [Colletotrichum spaethianum]GKT48738.1 hypothetical protein ColSpa_08919 [Colletotrichum spaethianum]
MKRKEGGWKKEDEESRWKIRRGLGDDVLRYVYDKWGVRLPNILGAAIAQAEKPATASSTANAAQIPNRDLIGTAASASPPGGVQA